MVDATIENNDRTLDTQDVARLADMRKLTGKHGAGYTGDAMKGADDNGHSRGNAGGGTLAGLDESADGRAGESEDAEGADDFGVGSDIPSGGEGLDESARGPAHSIAEWGIRHNVTGIKDNTMRQLKLGNQSWL